ncbi:UNVERIFIED_CONTAM: hypothetical protein FKN15_016366 [Acipenser sinensis]
MVCKSLLGFGKQLLRIKVVDCNAEESRLSRCLNTFDLIALGVGSTLGAGVYVLAGAVARENAGPAIVLCFLIAALASVLAGLCYAEFGARVPKTGSAYLYSYVTVGELWAFITGWNLILAYVIGTSSVARAWSATFDELIGKHIEHFCRVHMPMKAPGILSDYPDIFAVFIILVLTAIMAFLFDLKDLVDLMSIGTLLAYTLVAACVLVLRYQPDQPSLAYQMANTTDESELNESVSNSDSQLGFLPEEDEKCTLKTLLFPKNSNPSRLSGFAVNICASVLGKTFYLSKQGSACLSLEWELQSVRFHVSFASDHFRNGQRWSALLISGQSELKKNPNRLNNGGWGFVRYQPDQPSLAYQMANTTDESELNESVSNSDSQLGFLPEEDEKCTLKTLLFPKNSNPSRLSGFAVNICASVLGVLIFTFCLITVLGGAATWSIVCLVLLAFSIAGITAIIWRQPENKTKLSFKVPLLPFLPVFSMFVNVYLMVQLGKGTWIRFAIWMVLGFCIYFGYGIRHSTEAVLAQSSTEVTRNGYRQTQVFNGDTMAPEKEAFLDDEESDARNPWNAEEGDP